MPAQGQPQPPVIPQNQPVSAGSGEVMNRVPTTGAVPTPPPVPPAPTPTPPAAAATTPASPAPPSADGFGTNTQRSLLDVLKEMKALSTEQAEQLEVERISSGKTIEALLEEKNLVSELLLTQAKAALHNIPFVKIAETGSDPQALTQLPEVVANNYQILPISYNKQEGTLTVAMKDPLDLQAIDFAERKSGLADALHMPSELERSNYSPSLSVKSRSPGTNHPGCRGGNSVGTFLLWLVKPFERRSLKSSKQL